MNNIRLLKREIETKLSTLRNYSKCYILDAPFHENVGDILIYEGEKTLLKNNHITILGTYSYTTFPFFEIDSNILLVIHGGGNLGDIYPEHLDFLEKITDKYRENKIIVFPQTIFFANPDAAKYRLKKLTSHPNLHICARDQRSLNILQTYFCKKRSLLVPDMAFYLIDERLIKTHLVHSKTSSNKRLFIQRIDDEKKNSKTSPLSVNSKYDKISDWPSFQYSFIYSSLISKVLNNLYRKKISVFSKKVINSCWQLYFKLHCHLMIKEGINFLLPYDVIHTTRLHGAILGILLEKEVYIYDNSYGKNSQFYQTWLKNIKSIHFINEENENNHM